MITLDFVINEPIVWVKFWANGNNGPEAGEWEYGLATKAIEACAKAGAKHIVYSTLDDIPYVPHMVWKNKGEQTSGHLDSTYPTVSPKPRHRC